MYRRGFGVILFVAACGGSTHVSTSSTPPSGGAADGAIVPSPPDAGSIGADGGVADAGAADAGAADGGGRTDGGAVDGGGDGGVASCPLPGPTKLASAHAVIKMRVDGDELYFLDVASAFAGLYRMPKAGGPTTLVASVRSLGDDGTDWDLAIDETTIYLTFARIDDGFGLTPNNVTVIDKASGATRSVPVTPYGCTRPAFTRVTAAGGTAWLVQHNGAPFFSPCTQAPFDTIEVLPSGATRSRTIETLAPGTSAILADATHLFWSGAQGTFRARHDGSSVEALAPVAAGQLVTDGSALFAAIDTSVDAIGAPQQYQVIYENSNLLLFPAQSPLAVDETSVYVATSSGVISVDKQGGNQRTVVPQSAMTVAVDATNVYYFTSSSNSIMTACK